jgi:hypothetical protein
MEIATLVLEYLKVLLSPQIVIGGLGLVFLLMFREDIKALLLRVAKIKFPGGTEVSTSQSERQSNEEKIEQKPPPAPEAPITGLPTDLPPAQRLAVENILKAERATSYLWEYRYLNYFLVYSTQTVLNWLISLSQLTTYSHYDATWLLLIPSANERGAIINALQAHHLIQVNDGVIQVTPKGIEYQQWRGELPKPPLTTG